MSLTPYSVFAEKYKIIRKLDSGGFSDIYHGYDLSHNPQREIALKLFELIDDDSEKRRECMALFLREAYCLSKLNHPNIIQIYDFGHIDQRYYLITEYLSGTTIYDIVDNAGPLPSLQVAVVLYEISSALDFLRHHRIIHRDIKPINIMVNVKGEIKLIDFGLSKHINEQTVSLSGDFIGTPQYAAPESIYRDPSIDNRADVFSLGATCYYLLTGVEPFPGENPQEVFENRFRTVPKPLLQLKPDLDSIISNLIHKMLSERKEERPSLEKIHGIVSKILAESEEELAESSYEIPATSYGLSESGYRFPDLQ